MAHYNIFINGYERTVSTTTNAYEASALVNAFLDNGFKVESDLWGAYIEDAMLTPSMIREYGKGDLFIPWNDALTPWPVAQP